MGLQERRALKEFQDKHFPDLKKQVENAAGFPVAIEVKWESLATDGMSHLYAEAYPPVYFEPVIQALKSITSDDMGKEALKASLKKIQIHNTKGVYGATGFAFTDGVLDLDHEPTTNIGDVKDRAAAIQELLEKAL